jgi:hypothetical protein
MYASGKFGELGLDVDIPVCIIFYDKGGRLAFFYNPALYQRYSSHGYDRFFTHLTRAFM